MVAQGIRTSHILLSNYLLILKAVFFVDEGPSNFEKNTLQQSTKGIPIGWFHSDPPRFSLGSPFNVMKYSLETSISFTEMLVKKHFTKICFGSHGIVAFSCAKVVFYWATFGDFLQRLCVF